MKKKNKLTITLSEDAMIYLFMMCTYRHRELEGRRSPAAEKKCEKLYAEIEQAVNKNYII